MGTRMARLGILTACLLALGALLPHASAQVPGASATVVLSNFPAGPVSTNNTIFVGVVQLQVTLSGVVCATEGDLQVFLHTTPLVAVPSRVNLTLSFTNNNPIFKIPRDEYLTKDFSASDDATLQVIPDPIPTGGLELPIQVTATLPPGPPRSCTGASGYPEKTDAQTYTVRFNRATEEVAAPPSPEMPGPGALLALAVLGAAVVELRARRLR